MKKISCLILLIATFLPVANACEYNLMGAKATVRYRSVDKENFKERIKKIGSVSGKMIHNGSGSVKIFKTKENEHQMSLIKFNQDFYSVFNNTYSGEYGLDSEVMKDIIEEAVGENKLAKDQELARLIDQVTAKKSYQMKSSFYYGYSFNTDNTVHSLKWADSKNQDIELRVDFDFNRVWDCK